jgi:hypothetical protein
MTTETTEDGPGGPDDARRRRSRLPWLFAALVVLAVAVVSVAVIVRHDGGSNHEPTGAQQIAAIEQGCAQWHRSYAGASAPPANWCSAMSGWMNGQLHQGRMMGNTMWRDPEQMRAACAQWSAHDDGSATSAGAAGAWCDAMVAWMSAHPDAWNGTHNGWMMYDR